MLKGALRLQFFYDVCEEIDLAHAQKILGAQANRKAATQPNMPRYLGLQEAPAVLGTDRLPVDGDRMADVEYKAFPYGVVALTICLPFSCEWQQLLEQSSKLLEDTALARVARRRVEEMTARFEGALRQKYAEWPAEDYLTVEVEDAQDEIGTSLGGAAFAQSCAGQIARLVRGETQPLSETEVQEVLTSTLSCYPSDVMVVGWAAAVVFDATEGRRDTRELIEYANSQLLEFRHYDSRLAEILKKLYDLTQQRRAWWRQWGVVRESERLYRMRLEVHELAERSDNSLRLLGDMFYARAYKLISRRIGLDDYRRLVEDKMSTAKELYDFQVGEFNHQRAFVLEAIVVLILIIDLVLLLFKPK